MSSLPEPKRPEILAPAGDRASLEAAVLSGADAVYLGLSSFNARARAKNFDDAEFEDAVRFAHTRGVRVYVALNTLAFDHELSAVADAIRAAARAGADALIVQDVAVAVLARELAPGLPVHASTQMTCTDAASVELAKSLGATRVVLARELSVEDVARIHERTDTELEVFVHGALCVSYSGQCLTSEAIGGRSANRGACAQACRLPYDLVVDGEVRPLGDAAYLLSPEDLEASSLVPDLAKAGVVSLKIEGRLKGPEYVAATTRLYRRAADAFVGKAEAPEAAERERALQTYSRGSGPGFLAGIDHQRLVDGETCDHRGLFLGEVGAWRGDRRKPMVEVVLEVALRRGDGVLFQGKKAGTGEVGGRVWGLTVDGRDVESAPAGVRASLWLGPDKTFTPPEKGTRVWKTSDPTGANEIRVELEQKAVRRGISVHVAGTWGKPARFTARVANRGTELEVSVDGDVDLAPSERPVTVDMLRDKLGKLGESPFFLEHVTFELPEKTLVAPSSLNRARRALVEALLAEGHGPHAVREVSVSEVLARAPELPPPVAPGLFVLARNLEQARAAYEAGADGVYLDFLELTGTGAALRTLRAEGHAFVGVAPPRVRKPGEEKIDRYLEALEPDGTLVRGLGALHEGRGASPRGLRIGDFSLNVTNSLSAAHLLARGLDAFTPSFDLDSAQIAALLAGPVGSRAEVVVHHPMPLFYTEHCVFAALLSTGKDHKTCGRPCERHEVALRDRAGMSHPVVADVGCRNTVFHQRSQSAADLVPTLLARGTRRFRIELVREDARATGELVRTYRELVSGKTHPVDVLHRLKTEAGYGVVRGSLRILPS
jgi:putative protease